MTVWTWVHLLWIAAVFGLMVASLVVAVLSYGPQIFGNEKVRKDGTKMVLLSGALLLAAIALGLPLFAFQ